MEHFGDSRFEVYQTEGCQGGDPEILSEANTYKHLGYCIGSVDEEEMMARSRKIVCD